MLHPNLTANEVFVAEEDGGLLCKVSGFLTEHDTIERERIKWEEECVSIPKTRFFMSDNLVIIIKTQKHACTCRLLLKINENRSVLYFW